MYRRCGSHGSKSAKRSEKGSAMHGKRITKRTYVEGLAIVGTGEAGSALVPTASVSVKASPSASAAATEGATDDDGVSDEPSDALALNERSSEGEASMLWTVMV